MCPLRFILVFFSAVLAGYLAWRTARSSPEIDSVVADEDSSSTATGEKTLGKEKERLNLKTVVQNGFWAFVDMASGRYLWRNMREMKKE